MSNIALASINNFGLQQDQEQPSEPVFFLTSGQLRAVVQAAIQPLLDRIEALESLTLCAQQGREKSPWIVEDRTQEIQALKRDLESLQEENALERARDRQRIAKLEHEEPRPLQKDRGEVLKALIAAHGGKMLAKDARQKMRLSKQLFSMLLATMEDIEAKPLHSDNRKKLLVLRTP
jgi:hypothetical protein